MLFCAERFKLSHNFPLENFTECNIVNTVELN